MRSTLACLLALALPLAALAQDYRYSSIDYPGAITTVIYAVNNRGQVVGMEKDAAGTRHAIVGTPQQLSLLDPAGPIGTAPQSWAFSINRRSEIAGAYQDPAGVRHGYVRRSGGAFEMVDFPGAAGTEAFGINDTGTVIGIYYDAAGAAHAFTLKDGQYRNNDLEGAVTTIPLSINDQGEIVGEYVKTPDTLGYGFVEHRNGGFTLATAPGSAPEQTFFISINNRQDVLGTYADAAGQQFNFLRRRGQYLPFDLPASFGAVAVSAQTLNDHGDIVGYYVDAINHAHGFIATPMGDQPEQQQP